MQGKRVGAIAVSSIALAVMLGAAWHATAQNAKALYPSMAPLDQYLMEDRGSEIALARSAAPESISRDAEVLVLGGHGYETAIQGKNGFVCIVQRSWTAPIDDPDFWNPKLRAGVAPGKVTAAGCAGEGRQVTADVGYRYRLGSAGESDLPETEV